jgi:hypothetical protein
MTRRNEEIFSLNAHTCTDLVKSCYHIGMPWPSGGTDGQKFAVAVEATIKEFNLQKKVIAYTSDGRKLKKVQGGT